MIAGRTAVYARVSSEAQARENTIASQLVSLRERVAADGFVLEPDDCFVDEGYSGSVLVRPALEQLRDAAASGQIDRLYVHSPDRLARRYAHQALLVDELRRAGVDIVFLNRPIGETPEDDLLLQVQGVIAEYERAKILERGRRGRRHAARSGSVSALHIRLDRTRSSEPARGVSALAANGLPDSARFDALVRLDRSRDAGQSSLYGACGVRAFSLLAAAAPAAAVEETPQGLLPSGLARSCA